jgi:hypothetical protein
MVRILQIGNLHWRTGRLPCAPHASLTGNEESVLAALL